MIIGIYTDAHFSKSSSVFNQVTGYKYSARLDMLVNSFKWMYDEFSKHNVDVIVNAGDLLDSTVIDSATNSALYEALSYSKGIHEIHLLGNHEKDSIDGNINSVSLLKGFSHISLYTTPAKINDEFSVLPYMLSKDAEEFDLSSIKSKVLFSHVNYYGMKLGPYSLEEGISVKYASSIFDLVLNGHIHTPGEYNDGRVVNIGSMVGHGFGDSYSSGNNLPSIMILDTDTLKFTRVKNPYSVLFLNYKVNSISELTTKLSKIKSVIAPTNKVVLKVSVPYELRNSVEDYISKLDYIIVSRVVSSLGNHVNGTATASDNTSGILSTDSIVKLDSDESSIKFLKSYIESVDEESLPAPKPTILKFIDSYL